MADQASALEFDALLLVSFGGPEGPDDVVPFLQNVTRGRDIPEERLREVGMHYFHFDGVSPINGQNREFLAALRAELPTQGIDLPIYWGNRNWAPYLADALPQMRADGVKRALAFFTSAYSSYSGCRQYRENVAAACHELGDDAPVIERLGPYFNHPGFVEPFVDATAEAVIGLSAEQRAAGHLVFTTHSIPEAMADTSGHLSQSSGGAYVQQHREVAGYIAAEVAARTGVRLPWTLVYQSRSGAPQIPWLEPDVEAHLRALAHAECSAAVVVPIGFVSDHLEVLWDLDTGARETADEVGLHMVRVPTPGTDPRMVAMVGQLVRERIDSVPQQQRVRVGSLGAAPDACPAQCCLNPRGPRPTVGGVDA